jgi:hypothetical protein
MSHDGGDRHISAHGELYLRGLAGRATAMRSDMFKVIVERPRVGGHGVRKGRPPRDVEDYPSHQGIRRRLGYHGKEFNEHLGPLRRYLRKQVGRPWNKVYSEICEHLRAGNVVHDHVRLHVFDYVSDPRHPVRGGGFKMFYVDPRTGLLRLSKGRRR